MSCVVLIVLSQAALAQNNNILYDRQQVETHKDSESCWMIINDKVYDVTSYIPEHPAPVKTILEHCGQDATVAFNTKGRARPHSKKAIKMLSGYMIGELKKD